MNHAEIVEIKRRYKTLEGEIRNLREMEQGLEAAVESTKKATLGQHGIAQLHQLEERLIRTRANIGACLRRQEELQERVKGAWR